MMVVVKAGQESDASGPGSEDHGRAAAQV